MKNLLIILISIILLSSPVIGDNHKGETLYGWGKYPEIVWKGFGDKETHSVYKGDVKDGKEHGQGTKTNILEHSGRRSFIKIENTSFLSNHRRRKKND